MESIQELLRKLCKCIVKSDDGYKINIELEKSDPEPGPDPDPDPPTPDPEIDPNSPEAKFDPNIPLFIENAQEQPIYFNMKYSNSNYTDISNTDISYSYDNVSWQPLTFTKESSNSTYYISNNIVLYRKGDRAYFKGNSAEGLITNKTIKQTMFYAERGIPSDCCVDVGGNITSLFYGKDDKFKTDYLDLSRITHTSSDSMIGKLFGGVNDRGLSTYIRVPPALPATTLCPGCYYGFFYNSNRDGVPSHLEYIPVLPAKKTERDCYTYMFQGYGYSSPVSAKHDKVYCYTIYAEDVTAGGFSYTYRFAKYFKINDPNIIPKLGTVGQDNPDGLDLNGIIYCPTDPGNKLPAGWKWVKIPPLE